MAHGFRRKEPRKKNQLTPLGIDPGTVRLVEQRLNHYATPDVDGAYIYKCASKSLIRKNTAVTISVLITFRCGNDALRTLKIYMYLPF